jgi:hypothetical protein
MEYRFGPNKPKFTGTDDEWNKLKQTFAIWNKDTSIYPFFTVICPHCGAINTHISDGICSYRECHLIKNKAGMKIYYECPGYYVNAPK